MSPKRRRIDHILSGFSDGDAISQETLILQKIIRESGYESEIFVVDKNMARAARDRCRSLSEYKGDPDGAVIHQYSLDSEAADVFIKSPAKKIMRYQNITPASCFQGFDDNLAKQLETGRKKLAITAEACDRIWAASEFNLSELQGFKIKNACVLQLLFDPERFNQPEATNVKKKFRRPLKNMLFVGRIAPNKMVEDLILMFAWYNRAINPFSRLILVGSDHSCPRYYTMLRMLAASLDVPNICFEGFASEQGLATYYRLADIFLCASEHEGYCLPLVEAMYHSVPVIARKAGGMPEALNNAGILYEGLDHRNLAELAHRVMNDNTLRAEILSSQAKRMAEIKNRPMKEEVVKLLEQVLS